MTVMKIQQVQVFLLQPVNLVIRPCSLRLSVIIYQLNTDSMFHVAVTRGTFLIVLISIKNMKQSKALAGSYTTLLYIVCTVGTDVLR